MRWPTMTTRRWAITIGVIAVLLVPLKIACDLGDSLEAFYGPNGKLALEHDLSGKLAEVDALLERGDGAGAEPLLRVATVMRDRLTAVNRRLGWGDATPWDDQLASSLGAARSAQGRLAEAEAYHQVALASIGQDESADKLWATIVLQRSSQTLRQLGRLAEAQAQEERAIRALDRMARALRAEERGPEADRLDAQATALRQRPAAPP